MHPGDGTRFPFAPDKWLRAFSFVASSARSSSVYWSRLAHPAVKPPVKSIPITPRFTGKYAIITVDSLENLLRLHVFSLVDKNDFGHWRTITCASRIFGFRECVPRQPYLFSGAGTAVEISFMRADARFNRRYVGLESVCVMSCQSLMQKREFGRARDSTAWLCGWPEAGRTFVWSSIGNWPLNRVAPERASSTQRPTSERKSAVNDLPEQAEALYPFKVPLIVV